MVKDVFQCCYTNTTKDRGATVVSGWDTVACSESVPPDALEGCTRYQKGNSSIWKSWRGPTNRDGDPVDEDGSVLNLLEIAGDGTYLYVMRSQFGLKDARGRRNMFSHAYILPCTDELLRDPNQFINISVSNFATSEEAALAKLGTLTQSSMIRERPLAIDAALKRAGIESDDELALFVSAVYEQMTNAGVLTPLFVQYDGTEEQLRALLFCLYTFLPLHLRRKLVSASADGGNTASYNVVFCRDASKHRLYFDSTKDASNAIPLARMSSIKRLGFVDFAVYNRKKFDTDRYFGQLEQTAQSLNVTSSSAAQIARAYRIAHTMLMQGNVRCYTDAQLDLFIDETLRLASHGSDALDDFLADMLDEVMRRPGFELTDDNWQDLANKARNPHSSKLGEAIRKYNLYRFEQLPAKSAASKLAIMGADHLSEYDKALRGTKKGQQILDAYFAGFAINTSDPTWENLDDVLRRSESLPIQEKTQEAIKSTAWKLYCSKLSDLTDAEQELNEYVALMSKLEKHGNARAHELRAKEEFWNRVVPGTLDYGHQAVYEAMDNKSDKAKGVIKLLHFHELLVSGSEEQFLRTAYDEFQLGASSGAQTVQKGLKSCLNRMMKDDYVGPDGHLGGWLDLVERASRDGDESWLDALLDLRNSIEGCRWEDLCDEVQQLESVVADMHNGRTFRREACKLIYSCLCDIDGRAGVGEDGDAGLVPLDVWLTLGDVLYAEAGGGPFQILNRTDYVPMIIRHASELAVDVVSSSRLFDEGKYQRHAADYIGRGGPSEAVVQRKAVAFWLNKKRAEAKTDGAGNSPANHMVDANRGQGADEPGLFGSARGRLNALRGFFKRR